MNKKNYLKNVLCIMTLIFTMTLSAQSEQEVLQDWTTLEEADFLVDVTYKLVKCSDTSNPEILLNVFNESGMKTDFGFTLHLKDGNNNTKDIVLDLSVPQAEMWIANCKDNKYPDLKIVVPTDLDVTTLSITITYKE